MSDLKPTGLYSLAAFAVMGGVFATVCTGAFIIGVGLSYNPDLRGAYAGWTILGLAALVLAFVLLLRRNRQGPLNSFASILAMVLGALFALPAVVASMGDPGDAALYLGPILLGAGLIVLAFEPKNRGDAV